MWIKRQKPGVARPMWDIEIVERSRPAFSPGAACVWDWLGRSRTNAHAAAQTGSWGTFCEPKRELSC